MAYPYADQPTDSANSTVAQDTHPDLHNDANAALNDLKAVLGADPAGAEATVQARIAAAETAHTAHLGDTGDAHDASAISFAPAGTIAATTVQAAIEEVASEAGGAHPDLASHDALGLATDAELSAHTGDTSDAHDASAISFSPAGSIAATDVQAAIEEVAAEASASGIPGTIVDAKGDLIAATAADTVARLPVGANGKILSANSAQSTGLEWVDAPSGGIATTLLDAKGDLIAASAADTAARLAVGSNGQVLTADSAEATGMKWAAASGGLTGYAMPAILTNDSYAPYPGALIAANTSTETPTANDLNYEPFWLPFPVTVTGLAVHVATNASATGRLGIVELDPNTLQPTDLIVDAGTVDASSTGLKAITGLSAALTPGVYAKVRIFNLGPSLTCWQLSNVLGSAAALTGTFASTYTHLYVASAGQHTALSDPPPNWANTQNSSSIRFKHAVGMQWTV